MNELYSLKLRVTKVILVAYIRKTHIPDSKHFHDRPAHGVVYKLTGKTRYSFAESAIDLSAGRALYLPHGCDYTVETIQPGDCIAVNFQADVTGGLEVVDEPFLQKTPAQTTETLFRRIGDRWKIQPGTGDNGNDYRVMSLLYGILDAMSMPLQDPNRKLLRAQKLAHRRLEDPSLTVEDLAKEAEMSPSYFRGSFSKVYGVSPVKYIVLIRISRARELLTETQLSCAQIAEKTGFSDVFYFSRVFKSLTGTPPSVYRKESPY